MIVVKIEMWPLGDASKARLLSQATITCIGAATEARGTVRKGERAYAVKLFKDTAFGGPLQRPDLTSLPKSKVWREGTVRGHVPGKRGVWDLVGGALKTLLGPRLNPYVDQETP